MVTTSSSSSFETPVDARAFFQDLHDAFAATLRHAKGSGRVIEPVTMRAFDTFQGNVASQSEDEPPLACQRGCAVIPP